MLLLWCKAQGEHYPEVTFKLWCPFFYIFRHYLWHFSQSDFHFFWKKYFGGHKSFSWGHWYPCFGLLVMSALGFKARVDPFCVILTCVILRFTFGVTPIWLYRGQHGNWAFLIHIPADMSISIGGGSGLEPTTVRGARNKHGAVFLHEIL